MCSDKVNLNAANCNDIVAHYNLVNDILPHPVQYENGSKELLSAFKRLQNQFVYINEIVSSSRNIDRKLEIVTSAIGVASNIVKDNPALTMYYTSCVLFAAIQLKRMLKRKQFKIGGVEIIDDRAEIIIKPNGERL